MISDKKAFTGESVIGEYADYLDTGIWSMNNGRIVAPEDLTIRQLEDFLRVFGGEVYLDEGKISWRKP